LTTWFDVALNPMGQQSSAPVDDGIKPRSSSSRFLRKRLPIVRRIYEAEAKEPFERSAQDTPILVASVQDTLHNLHRLGLTLDSNFRVLFSSVFRSLLPFYSAGQVVAVADGGACSGQLRVGDTITEVNAESINGKDPESALAVFQLSCASRGNIVLRFDRRGKSVIVLS
jgi:hypothetical protein